MACIAPSVKPLIDHSVMKEFCSTNGVNQMACMKWRVAYYKWNVLLHTALQVLASKKHKIFCNTKHLKAE